MKSLHLPKDMWDSRMGYINIPGDDKPGTVREYDIPFTPIETDFSVADKAKTPIYWNQATDKYYEYKNNAWVEADQSKIGKILEDKSYIDMPNMDYFAFLNPRDIFWGLKVSFEF
jgi:hypothetical protein